MGQIGPWQLAIILVLVVIVFGSKKLPDTARALGKSLRILKSETSALRSDGDKGKDASAPAALRSDGDKGKDVSAPADGEQQTAPKTIQAAPGDVSSARPVEEPKGNAQS